MIDPNNIVKSLQIDSLTADEQMQLLAGIEKSIKNSRVQRQEAVKTNVDVVMSLLKRIEQDIRSRYDEVGNKLETHFSSIADGKNGKDGKDGKPGRDGRDGPMGARGQDGRDGKDGADGQDGVSVTDAKIDFDGSLIITLSTGREINVGEVVAADLAEKIRVTMSTNSTVTVQDEGTTITSGVRSINFTGTGVTATASGDSVTVNISGGGGGVYTANGVVYADSTTSLATGSALVFDGTNLGVGVTPNAWSGFIGIQVKNASLVSYDSDSATLSQNAYFDGSNWKYIATNFASQYEQFGGNHNWLSASSGTAGSSFSYTQTMVLTAAGNLGIGTTFPTEKLDITGNAVISGTLNVVGNITQNGAQVRTIDRVVAYTDATSITINADTTDMATMANTQSAGTFTVNAPTGTLVNGQKLLFRMTSTNVQTFSWNAVFRGSTDLALPTASSGAGKEDYLGFIYDSTSSKWDLIAKNFGF
tara:strand:+ start:499 stop:1926 length:1428 start_codon:yes stop_codon:yes gene_type:complete